MNIDLSKLRTTSLEDTRMEKHAYNLRKISIVCIYILTRENQEK